MDSLEFYKKQSIITEPGKYGVLFDNIPMDIKTIKSLLDGLLLHFNDGKLYNYTIPFKKFFDIETRYISKVLKKIYDMDNSPLTTPRTLNNKIIVSCRDYATLFCSILRHHGIPARIRVAFSTYYFEDYNHDIVILEYWDKKKNKWCLVDPRINDVLVKKYQININFDLFDVPRDKLLVSGLAWQMVRNNKANADIFFGGDLNKNKGLWYIRDRLVQDFASLNQVEMLLWDAWGLMLSKQSIENDKNQLSYLDKIANMTIHPEHHLKEIVDRYKSDSNLKVPEKITSFSPIYKKRIIQV